MANSITSAVATKTVDELQVIAKKNARLFRQLFGIKKEGAQAVLDNIENVKVPEGLTKETMEAYRELINRVSDPGGTQAVRGKILDELFKQK